MLDQTPNNLFFTKHDKDDPRLGEWFKAVDPKNLPESSLALVGYPDDEGIKLNGGRTGAKDAPLKIREFLFKMTPYLNSSSQKTWPHENRLFDIGNISNRIPNLDEKHRAVFSQNELIYKKHGYVLSLGGGHDYGFSDASAFLSYYLSNPAKIKPVVINFDAHLDVRPNDLNLSEMNHSGTPFYRLIKKFNSQFDFYELGLQPQCNAQAHFNWAKSHGAKCVLADQLRNHNWLETFNQSGLSSLTPETPVFISFDMDCVSSDSAPGCSQSWSTGLDFTICLDILNKIYHQANVRGLGIYEVAPSLDLENKTSKSAALLAHQFIFKSVLK